MWSVSVGVPGAGCRLSTWDAGIVRRPGASTVDSFSSGSCRVRPLLPVTYFLLLSLSNSQIIGPFYSIDLHYKFFTLQIHDAVIQR